MGETRVKPDQRRQQSNGIGSNDPDAMFGSCCQHALAQIIRLADTRCNDDHGASAGSADFGNQIRNRVRRRCDDTQVGDRRQVPHPRHTRQAAQFGIFWIDRIDRAAKAASHDIGQHQRTERTGAFRRPDQGDGSRGQGMVQARVRHQKNPALLWWGYD